MARALSSWLLDRLKYAKLVKHYIKPLRERRRQVAYNARDYFESYHRAALDEEFSDRTTISAKADPLHSRFHYNAVENSIIQSNVLATLAGGDTDLLDVQAQVRAVHWISFYLEVLQCPRILGLDVSPPCVEALRRKFAENERVEVVQGNIADEDFDLGRTFDIINAIGVIFHIVQDDAWERAIANLARHLKPGGSLVVGGQFGLTTRNVQFHNTDCFHSWEEYRRARSQVALVNKRIRSLRKWRQCATHAGLRVSGLTRTKSAATIKTPENNVLLLRKAA